MNSYMNTQTMNSYMNSYSNKHNMAIRVFQIWWSGCSILVRQRRLRLWRRCSGESLSQWGGLLRAASACAASIEAGCGEWRLAAASDYRDGPRPVAGRGWPLRVTWGESLAATSEAGWREWWTAGCCEWLGPGRVNRAGCSGCAWRVTRVTVSSACCASRVWVTPSRAMASQLGPAWLWLAWPFENKGGNIFSLRF